MRLFARSLDWLKMRWLSGSHPHPKQAPSDGAETGRKARLTILCSEIQGFSSISPEFPPEQVIARLNQYLDSMAKVVTAHTGTLDKCNQDTVMAFWEASPNETPPALHAVRCALQMRKALVGLNRQWGQAVALESGIGINTGDCIAGTTGDSKQLDCTIIGQAVSMASEIKGLTHHYGIPILIGESTHTLVESEVGCRLVDRLQVKNLCVKLYQPVAERKSQEWERLAPLIQRYEKAWCAADAHCTQDAARLFGELAQAGDKLSEVHWNRLKTALPTMEDHQGAEHSTLPLD
jgi:class 3 adenylate cyclase